MITRKEKVLWLCFAVVLVLLFLLSSTDLIIKEREQEVYPVSVIVDDSRDDYYVNFRKGMDRAAMELNVDVSFITLYEDNNAAQQMELMIREQQDGVRALVVVAVEEAPVEELLAQKRITVPAVLVNESPKKDQNLAAVTTDFYKMGRTLGGQIAGRYPADTLVCLFRQEKENTVIQNFEAGICAALEAEKITWSMVSRQGEETFVREVGNLAQQEQPTVLVALDPGSLTELAGILSENPEQESRILGLYGRGTSIQILNYLDKGILSGLCVTDDFSAGYLSVHKAVDALTGRKNPEQTVLESHYIEKADLRKPQYEKMLYPIE